MTQEHKQKHNGAANSNKNQNPIRNLTAFLKSYLQSESGKRALTRSPKLADKSAKDSKNRVITWKEPEGCNSIASAFYDSVYK